MTKKYFYNILFLITFLFLFSCSPKAENTFQNERSSFIVGGTKVDASDRISQHIVLVYNKELGYMCTGTIIAYKTILTAAHCLEGTPADFVVIFSNEPFPILDTPTKETENLVRTVDEIVIQDDYETDFNKAPPMNQSDIGIIYLNEKIPDGYKPVQVLMEETKIKKALPVIVAGYGVTNVTYSEIKFKNNQKFRERMKRGEYVCDFQIKDASGLPTCLHVQLSGEGELRQTKNEIKYIFQSEVVLKEANSSTCSGDSGGPLFIEENGELLLAGVTSRGSLLCNGEGIYTLVPSFIDWLLTH